MIEYPQPGTRKRAIVDYMIEYMIESRGRPPSIRDFIQDEVGVETPAGALTSTSVLTYNIKSLVDDGVVLEEGDWHDNRRHVLAQGIFGVPHNVLTGTKITGYYLVAFDETAGIWNPCNPALMPLIELLSRLHCEVITIASPRNNRGVPDIWENVYSGNGGHIFKPSPENRPTQVLENILSEWPAMDPENLAVVTNDYSLALAATGFGSAVFPVPYPEQI